MDKTDKQALMVRVPLPGGRVARVPLSVLESYHAEGVQLAHDPNEAPASVTAHGLVIDQATGTSVWHTDTEFGPCDFVDDNGYHHSTVAYHCHPYGTEFTEMPVALRAALPVLLAALAACDPKTADSAASTSSSSGGPVSVAPPASVLEALELERSFDFAKAAALLEKECAAGSGEACRHLARFVRGGVGIERSATRALELEQKGCDGGDGIACAMLAERYWTADTVFADEKKAIATYLRSVPLLEKGCQGGRAEACSRLGVVFTNGWGVQADLTRAEAANRSAAELFKKSCEAGDGDACAHLARAHARGRGVGKDLAASATLYEKGCAQGSAPACHELGLLAEKESSQKATSGGKEIALLEKPCEKGSHDACVSMALTASQLLGPLGAEPYHRKACEGGSSHSCRELARGKEGAKDGGALKKRALELTTKACEAGDGVDCGLLGVAYIKGDVTASDAKKARQFLERGCTLADAASCLALGEQLAEGRGGMAKDAEAARAAFEKACKLGKLQACEKATTKK